MGNKDLKKAGLKVTGPRMKILKILENSGDRHLSAEDVYRTLLESGEDVGFATIYRTLAQFEDAKLIVRHNFTEGHSIFEMNQGKHHDHLVCNECGRVEEFFDRIIEERQTAVAKKAGFTISDHHLNIYGLCSPCQALRDAVLRTVPQGRRKKSAEDG